LKIELLVSATGDFFIVCGQNQK